MILENKKYNFFLNLNRCVNQSTFTCKTWAAMQHSMALWYHILLHTIFKFNFCSCTVQYYNGLEQFWGGHLLNNNLKNNYCPYVVNIRLMVFKYIISKAKHIPNKNDRSIANKRSTARYIIHSYPTSESQRYRNAYKN